MTIKLMLLKTGETLISDAKEVVQEEQVRGYLLNKPHLVRTQERTAKILMESETGQREIMNLILFLLSPWMILSSDSEFLFITTDYCFATICEPITT